MRLEHLDQALPGAVVDWLLPGAKTNVEQRNISPGESELGQLLNEELRELLYNKHRWIFDQGLYSPEQVF